MSTTAPSAFVVEPDRRCQRGLTFRYTMTRALPPQELFAALANSFGDDFVVRVEALGRTEAYTAVVQFGFELRTTSDPRELVLMHRFSCSPERRAANAARLEDTVRALTEKGTTR